MARSIDEILTGSSGPTSSVGTLESIFSGVAAGLIAIPKGFFSLGATLLDLGAGTNQAAQVEQFFDDLTEFDEKAEATAAGKITSALVNIGIPGGIAFKAGQKAAMNAMKAKKAGTYFKPSKELVETAQGISKKDLVLTAAGRRRKFLTGAGYGGVAEGVFVGDVEEIGTFGDLLGGPTAINREEDKNDPLRKLINRVKFGTEGALFTGVLGGIGLTAKRLADRGDKLRTSRSRIDKLLYNIAAGVRARGKLDPKSFDFERSQIGARAADLNNARNRARELETAVDSLFPSFKSLSDGAGKEKRKELLTAIDNALLSGEPKLTAKNVLNTEGRIAYERANSVSPLTEEEFLKRTPLKERVKLVENKKIAEFGPIKQEDLDALTDKINEIAPDVTTAQKGQKDILDILQRSRKKIEDLFTDLGATASAKDFIKFKGEFGRQTKDWLGATYELFTNKAIGPFLGYKPTRQIVEEAMGVFKRSSAEARERSIISLRKQGKTLEQAEAEAPKILTDLEAESIVNDILDTARLPKSFRMDRPSDPIFRIPGFFVNDTAIKDASKFRGIASLGQFKKGVDLKTGKTVDKAIKTPDGKDSIRWDTDVFKDLLGKQKNPMQTILGGTGRLSLITRRNEFFDRLVKENPEAFARSADEATAKFGDDIDGFDKIDMDPGKAIDVGSGNPLNGLYARRPVIEALQLTNQSLEGASPVVRLYENFILYPKATSQIAKTILSPVTHLRNFISAGAFAAANGIIPAADVAAVKNAYQALQTPLKGTRIQNDFYEKLLRLGVVNNNVRLGDLQRLLEDVRFGETVASNQSLGNLLKKLSKVKQVGQDLYTAEDDFWKIYSWAIEKDRLAKAFLKRGAKVGDEVTEIGRDGTERVIKLTDDYFEKQAADIVKNNIPNYDFVGKFVKDLRKFPVGNFVSFPAEIIRTGSNIVRRGLRETQQQFRINGNLVKPFESIGYTRLFGFGATTVAVPYGISEMFKALYNVTSEEMEALKRYVPDWSKNSTLIPIRKADGTFKYIDFSHANAYDTLTRPVQSVINKVAAGQGDEDGIMDDFLAGVFTATKELGEPFVSESIWTEAAADIILRQGRTRSGSRVYNPADTTGNKGVAIFKHLVEAQMPFSAGQIKRLGMSISNEIDVLEKGKFDRYGQTYELGDELGGLFGFRAVNVNPERSFNFKIADYQKGVRDSRSLFTAKSLRGGPIDARDIVQNYINANRALFKTRQNFARDIDAAIVLGVSDAAIRRQATERISNIDYTTIKNQAFRPLAISDEVRAAFAENAANLGLDNTFVEAFPAITQVQNELRTLRLNEGEFPLIENPLITPITSQLGLGTIGNTGEVSRNLTLGNNLNNLTTQQKIDILFNS